MRGFECLVYTSKVSDQFSDEDIALILSVAHQNNLRLDVTGALVFYEGCFMQYLEGPPKALDTLMTAIKSDPRHTAIEIRHRGPIHARRFEQCAMFQIDDSLLDYCEVEHGVFALELNILSANNCLEFFLRAAA